MKTKGEIVRKRLSKAHTSINQIQVLMENRFYEIVANRIYYACFHAASAALYQIDIQPKTHKGVHQMFGLHFVQTGLVQSELANTLPAAFFTRQQQDYNDFDEIDTEALDLLFSSARKFVERIQEIIENN